MVPWLLILASRASVTPPAYQPGAVGQHVTDMVIGRAFVDIAHGGGGIGEEVQDDLVFGLAEPVGSGVRLAEDDYWEVVFAVASSCWRERLSNAV